MPSSHILFADNAPDFLDTRAEFLENAGYRVLKAYTLEQARQLLAEARLHLAILDIRMENDDDEKDVSGLTLAKDPAFRPVPKIMLTGFPSYQYVREALGSALDALPSAVNFLSKKEGPEAMIRAVEEAFAQHVRINWELVIRSNPRYPLSFASLTDLLYPEMRGTEVFWERIEELEDLFRLLFFASTEICLDQILFAQAARLAVRVYAYPSEGHEERLVVTVGLPSKIQDEEQRYDTFASKTAVPGTTHKARAKQTLHFAVIAYDLIGGDLEIAQPFGQYYQSQRDDEICRALDNLFQVTLSPLYEQKRTVDEDRTLDALYREWLALTQKTATRQQFDQRIRAICDEALATGLAQVDYSPYRLAFRLPNGSTTQFANPAASLYGEKEIIGSPVLCGTTAGCLRTDSILVSPKGMSWLIDFSQVGPGPVLCDFVALEAMIRFELMNGVGVQALCSFEERVVASSRLEEPIETREDDPTRIQKAARILNHLRRLAAAVPGASAQEYYAGLLFLAAREIFDYTPEFRHSRRELTRALHALIVSGLVCDKLTLWGARADSELPVEALVGLWLDEPTRQVWVEGRRVDVSKSEFDLLSFMYRNAGRVCDRPAITEAAFGEEYQGKPVDDSKINTFMDRLREKVEPDPSQPKYIVTVRGVGYKLHPAGRDSI